MRARVIAVGVATVAYVLGSHWLMTSAPPSPWNAVVVVGPMLACPEAEAFSARFDVVDVRPGSGHE